MHSHSEETFNFTASRVETLKDSNVEEIGGPDVGA